MSEELAENYRAGNQHARSHGFSAENLCLTTEERPAYDALHTYFENRFHPADPVEMEFVDEMVNARWRMKRIVISETGAINHQIAINEEEVNRDLPETTNNQRNSFTIDTLANERKT